MSASRVYLVIRSFFALAESIMFTTYALYYVEMLGLNPLQLVLVGTALEAAVFLFEIPTGVVADVYSRRLSIIIGTFVMGGAYLLEGFVPYLGGVVPFFALVALAEVVRGIGWTFMSGAGEAWVTDEVGVEQVGALFLKAGKLSRLMHLIGIPLSVLLATVAMNLPYLVGGVLVLGCGIFMLLRMPETAFTPRPREDRSTWALLAGTFKDGVLAVRGRPVLIALLLVSVISGAASEGFARLWPAHFLALMDLSGVSTFSAATWLGIMSAASSLVGMGAAHLGERHLDLSRARVVTGTLLATTSMHLAAVMGMALAPGFGWIVGVSLLNAAVQAVHHPVWDAWVNRQVDSSVRATVLSMIGQADALGQTGGGPFVGWVGTRWSIRAALGVAAVLQAPALAVFGWVFRRGAAAELPDTERVAAD